MKKISRRSFLAASVAVCAAAALSGCGAASSAASSAAVSGTASSAAASGTASSGLPVPSGSVNLKFANYALLEDAYTEFWNGVKSGFETQYPNITIEWVTAPYGDIVSTVTTMAGAGDKCDMIFGEVGWTPTFEDSGLTIPVTDVLTADFLEGFYESALNACTVNGDVYALPMYVSPFILYYNTDILKQAGVDKVPSTYDELLTVCEKISGMKTSDGNVIYPFGQTTASVPISGSAINSMVYNFGGQVLDDSGALSIDNDGFHQAIEMLQTLDEKGYNPQNCKLKDLRNLFALGQLAIYYDQSWGISGVKAINADIDAVTASAVPLAGGAGKGASILSAHTLFYADNGESNRQACALLTEYLMSDEVLGDYMANIVPAYPALKSMSVPDNHVLAGAADAIGIAVASPFVPTLSDLNLELCTLAQAVTVSDQDIAVRLRKAIRWRALWPPVLASLACGWLGVDTLMRLDDAVLRRILGASLLVLACYFLFLSEKIRLKGGIAAGLAAGAVSGFCGGLFNIGGPPAVAYFLAVAHSKEEYNATLQAYFCLTTLNIFGVHFLRGNVTAAMLPLFAAALAGVGAGTLLGFAVFRRLTMQNIRKFIYGFMTAAGLYLLLRG